MAIQKEKVLKSGAVGNYWRIISITIDRQNLSVIGTIGLFKDKNASDTGKQPMPLIKAFRFPLVMLEIAPPVDIIAYVYTKIQAAADVVVLTDILGKTLDVPTTVDPDISGGTPV